MTKRGKKKHPPRPAVAPTRVQAPSAATVEADLRRGFAAFERGDHGEANQAWQQARRTQPSAAVDRALAEARFRRALAAPNPARQAQELQTAVELNPSRAVYHYHLGLAYHRQGQLRRALAAYEEAHRLAPADYRIRRHLALALLSDPAGAARARDLLAGAPAADEAAARLQALAALRTDDSAAAAAALAARKAPSPLANLALGLPQLAAGETAAALATLAKVLRSRRPLSAEVRQAAALGSVVASVRAGDLAGGLKLLHRQQVPASAELRQAFAAASQQLGLALVLDERLDDAIFAWRQARAAAPSDELIRGCLDHLSEVAATRAARQGDFVLARQHWETALADQPGNARLLRNLALAEERLGDWRQAAARWEELIRQWKKELQAARREEGAAVELRGRLTVAHRQLASAYQAAGDVRVAARALERALDFEESDDLRLRAAELYLEGEDYSGAIAHLRRVLAARPNDVRILIDLGMAYDRKGDDRQALSYLEQALALEPENPAVKVTLASVHHGRGHRLINSKLREQAAAEFQRAAELAPHDAEHWRCLGELYLELDRASDAATTFRRVLALKPLDPALRVLIGSMYLERGQAPEAEKYFRQALRIERSPTIQAAIGVLYLTYGDPAKADAYFQRTLKGRDPWALDTIAHALDTVGRSADAVPYLERAVALNPISVNLRIGLAMMLVAGLHDYARALAELRAGERLAKLVGDSKALASIAEIREELEEVMAAGPREGGRPSRGG